MIWNEHDAASSFVLFGPTQFLRRTNLKRKLLREKIKVRRCKLQIPKICDAVPRRAVQMGSIVNISCFKFFIIKKLKNVALMY